MTGPFPDDVPLLTDGVVTLRAHRRADVPAVLEQCEHPLSQRWTTDGSLVDVLGYDMLREERARAGSAATGPVSRRCTRTETASTTSPRPDSPAPTQLGAV